jgi:hypothetical protein
MPLQETSIKVKSGKYTFIINEKTLTRDEDIMYTSLQIGGDYPDCVSIFINYNDKIPSSAKMPHVMYDEKCVENSNIVYLERGDGSRLMIKTLIAYLRKNYPTITEIEFDDMSSIECATEEEIAHAKNIKHGSHLKPMTLYNFSIAYNGQTWYEKYFGARHKNMELHSKYRERVNTLLYEKSTKPSNFNEFIKITHLSQDLVDELFEFYKSSDTYSQFFHSIPKSDGCRLIRPWIDTFMAHYLKNVFNNMNWIIPTVARGGKKMRHTQRKTTSFYVPNVRLSRIYQPNLGVSVDDL